jgi:tRNA G10  N-methylase Trm11
MAIGFTLNICCGADPTGDVKADIDAELLRHLKNMRIDDAEYVVCDVMHPPFRDDSFDTVICDPPFKFYNKFKWIRQLVDLARKRVILSVPPVNIHLDKTCWEKELYYTETSGIFIRLWWVFTKRGLLHGNDR